MVLIQRLKHYLQARSIWQKGFPKARSIKHASDEWTPYIETWTRWIEQGTYFDAWIRWRTYSAKQHNYQLAWITYDCFWKALAKYSMNHLFSWWPEITQEAAKQGNVVALQNIPQNNCRAYFRRVDAGHQSTHPRSVQWAESMGFIKPNNLHLTHWTLDSPIETSPWTNGYKGQSTNQYDLYSMSQWCISAAECYPLSHDQALDAVGHCMRLAHQDNRTKTSIPWQWFEETVRPIYNNKMDWDLLASLHGIALPLRHPLQHWSDSLILIAKQVQFIGTLNAECLRILPLDPVLQFVLDTSKPLNIKNMYRILSNTNSPPIDVVVLPEHAF